MSVLVNGAPTEEYSPNRGLRQGDPLSPLLFNLVGEVLSRLLNVANSKKIFEGIRLPGCSSELTHLQFADDVVLFIDRDLDSIKGVKRVLQCFELLSGLHIHYHKSSLYGFSEDKKTLSEWADCLGCEVGKDRFTYPGNEIGASPSSIRHWDPLISKVKNRLLSWKAEHLSIAGRLVLLKASIDSLPAFWFSLFKLPTACLQSLEKAQMSFLWGETTNVPHKLHLLSWKSICQPKSGGGLGLKPLKLRI